WIRVIERWGGTGWGTQFIPRIGMEVMVGFLSGDPDCPVVIGSAYNATHPTTFRLPAEKTRSGIRTQSTPGGGGFNQLSFKERKGLEQVYVHAQRDLAEVVENNHSTDVKKNQSTSVGVDQAVVVHRDRVLDVKHNLTQTVGHDLHEKVVDGLFLEV